MAQETAGAGDAGETSAQDDGTEELAGAFDEMLGAPPEEGDDEDDDTVEIADDGASEDADDPDAEGSDEEEGDEEEVADEDDASEDEDADHPVALKDTTPLFTILEPDGKSKVITVAEAKAGYLRTADYTRKRMAEAEIAKDAAKERDTFREYNKQYAATLDKFLVKEPDWEKLRTDDPEQYLIAKQDWKDIQDERAKVRAAEEALTKEDEARQAKALATFLEEETVKLHEALPHWKAKPLVAQQEAVAIHRDLRNRGFTDEQISVGMADHRMVLLSREAALFRQMKAKFRTKARPASKGTLKPGATVPAKVGKQRVSRAATERLRRTGSLKDAGAAFEDMPELD